MSPRRKVDGADRDYFSLTNEHARPPRRWGLAAVAAAALALVLAAIAGSVFIFVSHRDYRDQEVRNVDAVGYVRSFMTEYTTLDPFHANDYADRILAQGTGDFAKSFKDKMNEIVVQVARAEPTTGTVPEAGVQRWNDNGSADVLVATTIKTVGPDGKTFVESGSRWVVTTIEEGQQWKISQLIQVI